MAIYGAGSTWDNDEQCDQFFASGRFTLGWNHASAEDLYSFIASLKAGDLIYLKANRPGSNSIRVKGIGFVKSPLLSCMLAANLNLATITDWQSLYVEVEWVVRTEFLIEIPGDTGKLTNVRAATVYEEHLPYVQDKILRALLISRVALEPQDVETLIESLSYSKQRVADAQGTPYGVRQENLGRIEAVTNKLRAARRDASE